MNCREFADFLDLYVAGDLAPTEREEFDSHLAECPTCVRYLDGYRKTIQYATGAAARERLLEAAPPELVKAILAARVS